MILCQCDTLINCNSLNVFVAGESPGGDFWNPASPKAGIVPEHLALRLALLADQGETQCPPVHTLGVIIGLDTVML